MINKTIKNNKIKKFVLIIMLNILILFTCFLSYGNETNIDKKLNNNQNVLEIINIITSIITSISLTILAILTLKKDISLQEPIIIIQDGFGYSKFNNSYGNLNKIFLDIINVGGNNALNVTISYDFNIKDFLENTNNLNNRVKNVWKEFIEFKSSFVRITKIENFKAIQPNKKLKLTIPLYISSLFYEYAEYVTDFKSCNINFPEIEIFCQHYTINNKKNVSIYKIDLQAISIKYEKEKLSELTWAIRVNKER